MHHSSLASVRPHIRFAIGVAGIVLGLVLGDGDPEGPAVILLGSWLTMGTLLRAAAEGPTVTPRAERRIPITFSGNLGSFELRSRGDGRRVEVRNGAVVVAKLIASDDGGELVVDFSMVDDADVKAFSAALGLAMEVVAAAEVDFAATPESVVAGPPRALRARVKGLPRDRQRAGSPAPSSQPAVPRLTTASELSESSLPSVDASHGVSCRHPAIRRRGTSVDSTQPQRGPRIACGRCRRAALDPRRPATT
jgi:hypothetical protein